MQFFVDPEQNIHDDLWIFNYKEYVNTNDNTRHDLWKEIKQTGNLRGKIGGYCRDIIQNQINFIYMSAMIQEEIKNLICSVSIQEHFPGKFSK